MLLNRLIDKARHVTPRDAALRRSARASRRPPLVVVTGLLGIRLAAPGKAPVWGTTRSLLYGPSMCAAADAVPAGILRSFPVIPGLVGVDVHDGLLRTLEDVGGYRLGDDLFALDYDWRPGVEAAARALDAAVKAFDRVDLLTMSTGGLVARAWLAVAGNQRARRVVHIGAPQRGTFDAIACLHRGFRFVPGGKLFDAREVALSQTPFDALPHPDAAVFVDPAGRRIERDLYDAATWAELALAPDTPSAVVLRRARELHRRLDEVATHPESYVIGARHVPTPCRVVVERGRGKVPLPVGPRDGVAYGPGDGELPLESLVGLPGLRAERVRLVRAPHAGLISAPEVHRLALGALLS